MKRRALAICIGVAAILFLVACSDNEATTSPTNEPTATEATATADSVTGEVTTNVSVFDDTQERPADGLEVWFTGTGSWFPDTSFGSDRMEIGPYPIGEQRELFVYPDGRSGTEMRILVQASADTISNSDRDSIIIEVSDSTVVVTSAQIDGVTQEFNR